MGRQVKEVHFGDRRPACRVSSRHLAIPSEIREGS